MSKLTGHSSVGPCIERARTNQVSPRGVKKWGRFTEAQIVGFLREAMRAALQVGVDGPWLDPRSRSDTTKACIRFEKPSPGAAWKALNAVPHQASVFGLAALRYVRSFLNWVEDTQKVGHDIASCPLGLSCSRQWPAYAKAPAGSLRLHP